MKKIPAIRKYVNFVGRIMIGLLFGIIFSGGNASAVDLICKDPQYSFQCLRTIGYAPSGGADIGECLSKAYRITEGDDESWYTEWVKAAKRLEQTKEEHTMKRIPATQKPVKLAGLIMIGLLLGIIASGSNASAVDLIFKDPQYSFQCLRTIGYAPSGGADIGECLSTAYRITEGDDESWYTEWVKTARRMEQTADTFLKEGHGISAREAYFRASNYYRTAEFFLHTNPQDPRILETWGKSRSCFIKAARLSDPAITPVEIPFEGTTLPGYLCLADNKGNKKPLLIIHSGFDGTGEELYFEIAYFAVKRGYNCLLFEGPGQGRVIREQKIHFRPNWETVVTPVVDFALTLPVVDPEKIALMGISMGGYLAPRAAAFEKRISVCIPNGGVYDFHAGAVEHFPPEMRKNIEHILNDKQASAEMDKDLYGAMKKDPGLRWVFSNGMWTFGAKSPSGYLRMTRPYNLKDTAGKIKCSMLVIDSQDDNDLPGQSKELYDVLTCPKEYMLFTEDEGAEEHCQMGATSISNERILNWLDTAFKKVR